MAYHPNHKVHAVKEASSSKNEPAEISQAGRPKPEPLCRNYLLRLRANSTNPTTATLTRAKEPGSGTVSTGPAIAKPAVAINPAATAATYLKADFILNSRKKRLR